MKKILHIVLLGIGLMSLSSICAQTTILYQNFETSKTFLPTGWHQQQSIYDSTNKGWRFDSIFPLYMSFDYPAPIHNFCAFVDEADQDTSGSHNVHNWDTLYTPVLNCSSNSHIFLSMSQFWEPSFDTATLAISTNGGLTWNTIKNFGDIWDTIYWFNNPPWLDSIVYDVSTYAAGKPNVIFAFTYNDGIDNSSYSDIGFAMDNIDVFEPKDYDVSVTKQNTTYLMKTGTPYTFTGSIYNHGGDSINSMTLNYSVNGGPAVSSNITGITGFHGLSYYNWANNIPYMPLSAGVITVKFWANNLNGANIDQNHSNDTLTQSFIVTDSIQQKIVLFEDIDAIWCGACQDQAPNVDTVTQRAKLIMNTLLYHTGNGGGDRMSIFVDTAFEANREKYYSVTGFPTPLLDGIYLGNITTFGLLSTKLIRQMDAIGSPFRITINTCQYDTLTNIYSINADIKAFADFNASDIVVKAVLTVDTMKYDTTQNNSHIPEYQFQPPIGNTVGGWPDSSYGYFVNFPNVPEAMMPDTVGAALAPISTYQTKNFVFSWKKNHAWGAQRNIYKYDSIGSSITLFIQDNSGISEFNIPSHYVYQSASSEVVYTNPILTSDEKVIEGQNLLIYPNPSSRQITLQWSGISGESSVRISIYDEQGQMVYDCFLTQVAGKNQKQLNLESLASGIYTLRMQTAGGTSVKKVVIMKK